METNTTQKVKEDVIEYAEHTPDLLKEPRGYRIASLVALTLSIILYFILEYTGQSPYVPAALIFLRIAIIFCLLCFVFTLIQKGKVISFRTQHPLHPGDKHSNYDFYGNLYHLFICLFLVFFILSIVLRYVYPIR